jgi:hypothetical protein
VTLIFAVMAWRELNVAATSPEAPAVDSMPLTKIVCPELFDAFQPGATPVKPAELASIAFTRIYLIGGVGLVSLAVGIAMLGTARPQRARPES